MRAPQSGDMALALAKMKSGRLTEFSGYIEEVSADHAFFALDSIHLIEKDYEEPPIESKFGQELRPSCSRSESRSTKLRRSTAESSTKMTPVGK